jgi:hypothetical protein
MASRIETQPATGFDSPLHLWIAIWQRQLVYGAQCSSAS